MKIIVNDVTIVMTSSFPNVLNQLQLVPRRTILREWGKLVVLQHEQAVNFRHFHQGDRASIRPLQFKKLIS